MKLPLLCLTLGGCLAACTARAQVSLVAVGRLHLAQAYFDDDALVSARIRLATWVYDTESLGVAWQASPRLAVQATVGYTIYGLAIETQRDYVRQPRNNDQLATSEAQALEAAVVARYYLGAGGQPGRWYAEAGADLLVAAFGAVSGNFGDYDAANPNGPGLEGRSTGIGGGPYRPGLRLGLGRAWQVSPRQQLALALVGSLGLHDIDRYRLETTVWQQGPTIDPVSYVNTVAIRASYVGVQAQYGFQLGRLR